MLLYLHDGSYMFRQNNAILREQLGYFLSYFNINMAGGKSWNVRYRPTCQRVRQRNVMEHCQMHTANCICWSISTYLIMHGTKIKIATPQQQSQPPSTRLPN
jgi:hypothetical protein